MRKLWVRIKSLSNQGKKEETATYQKRSAVKQNVLPTDANGIQNAKSSKTLCPDGISMVILK